MVCVCEGVRCDSQLCDDDEVPPSFKRLVKLQQVRGPPPHPDEQLHLPADLGPPLGAQPDVLGSHGNPGQLVHTPVHHAKPAPEGLNHREERVNSKVFVEIGVIFFNSF